MNNIKIVFMGTPDFSVPVLEALIKNYNVVAVVTQPDKQVGREGKIKTTPVKDLALAHNIPVLQPVKIRADYQSILAYEPDIIITCAYGQIIPKEIIDYPKYKCINVHASLLPKHRGGAPIHRAIIEGDTESGVTIMHMDYGMDNGDIITQESIPILDVDTAESLFNKLSNLGAELLVKTLPDILSNNINPVKQNENEATYSYNIKPEDELVDFNKDAKSVYNQIRGLNSWPVAYTMLNGKRLKVWESIIGDKSTNKEPGTITNTSNLGIHIQTKDLEIILTVIQPEGKKRMNAKDYLNGVKKEELIGKKLGD